MAGKLHAEGLGSPGDLEADSSQSKDAQLLAPQLGALQRLLLPLAGVQRGIRLGELAGQGEHQANGQLGHGNRIRARGVHYHDAAVGGRVSVDIVHAHSGPADDAQLGSMLQQGAVHLDRGADHERVSIGQLSGQPVLDLIVGYDLPFGFAGKDGYGGG